jgi:CRISPR-associated endonuclease Csn1
MPPTILGLDIGSNSIGWALLSEDQNSGEIIACGVRVFPEGVDRDQQGGEQSKTQARRIARGMRRQITRRARRKHQLKAILCDAGLLPPDLAGFEVLLSKNPYPLRVRALDERLQPHEIGRIFLQLNQRRGFLSNRKADRAAGKETKGMLAEISELAQEIEQTHCRTLGEFLARKDADFDPIRSNDSDRVRHRHTRRDMYEQEFDAIWAAQEVHHPAILTRGLLDKVRKHIFHQRRMYWPKSIVGTCELEPKEKRCAKADRAAQRFRILQEINNLRIIDDKLRIERALAPEERATLIDALVNRRELKFDDLRRKLSFDEHVRFNYERAERTKLKGMETDAALARVLKKSRWNEIAEQTKDRIVELCSGQADEAEAIDGLTTTCGLNAEEAQAALSINLPDGFMSYSKRAIEKLVPHLERGLALMGNDASDSALHAAGYLRPDQRFVRAREFLPSPPDVPNPIVRTALVEVRKVVNAIIREHGKPDCIRIELAREAKRSFNERVEIRKMQARRRRERESAAEELVKLGEKPTGAKIDRYRLWEEQKQQCIYCDQKISQKQLIGGEADIDHILPRWRSLDNSLANKVICHRACNRDKGDQTPREWLEFSDPDRYEAVLLRARRLPGGKHRKFLLKEIELDHFVARQLTDTAYISRLATEYLQCLGATIETPRGQMTADLRHHWGLNTILDPAGRGSKNRADHRHHAIDAVVIALTDKQRLHNLANDRFENVRPPWEDLRDRVEYSVRAINVSHRVRRGIKGALHEETFYGATRKVSDRKSSPSRPWAKGWVESDRAFVRRKPIEQLTDLKHVAKVRDETIRKILHAHLRHQGVDTSRSSGKLPKDAFKSGNVPMMPSGVPIKKVRMIEESETFRPVSERRAYQFVKPGSNHHIVYRETPRGKWNAQVVTMWEAATRARTGQPIIDRADHPKGQFVMSLSINEMFEIDDPAKKGKRVLCVVRKLDQRSRRIDYKYHQDARPAKEINLDRLYLSPDRMRQQHACKITIDTLGRIRRARD